MNLCQSVYLLKKIILKIVRLIFENIHLLLEFSEPTTLKLLLSIWIILSLNKMRLLQKKRTVNQFFKNLSNKRHLHTTKEFIFIFKQNIWEIYILFKPIKLLIVLRANDKYWNNLEKRKYGCTCQNKFH